MNSVEKVKDICKERKLPISKLEKDLGYSNGYIGQLRKGVFPENRLFEIADYLGVSADYIRGEEEKHGYYFNDETAAIAQEIFENKELRMLFDASRNAAPEDLLAAREVVLALKRKERRKYSDS